MSSLVIRATPAAGLQFELHKFPLKHTLHRFRLSASVRADLKEGRISGRVLVWGVCMEKWQASHPHTYINLSLLPSSTLYTSPTVTLILLEQNIGCPLVLFWSTAQARSFILDSETHIKLSGGTSGSLSAYRFP